MKSKKKSIFFIFLKNSIFFYKCQECWRSEGRKFFQNFFFEFLVQNDSIRKKKQNFFLKILIFFLSLRNVGDFDPFDPWRENRSFFGYGVFTKCYITSRRFYLQHFNKNVRAVFSQKPTKTIFDPFLTQKSGSKHFFKKSGSVTFFHLCSPNVPLRTDARTDGQTDKLTNMNL